MQADLVDRHRAPPGMTLVGIQFRSAREGAGDHAERVAVPIYILTNADDQLVFAAEDRHRQLIDDFAAQFALALEGVTVAEVPNDRDGSGIPPNCERSHGARPCNRRQLPSSLPRCRRVLARN
jgi:hypothetical protein